LPQQVRQCGQDKLGNPVYEKQSNNLQPDRLVHGCRLMMTNQGHQGTQNAAQQPQQTDSTS